MAFFEYMYPNKMMVSTRPNILNIFLSPSTDNGIIKFDELKIIGDNNFINEELKKLDVGEEWICDFELYLDESYINDAIRILDKCGSLEFICVVKMSSGLYWRFDATNGEFLYNSQLNKLEIKFKTSLRGYEVSEKIIKGGE